MLTHASSIRIRIKCEGGFCESWTCRLLPLCPSPLQDASVIGSGIHSNLFDLEMVNGLIVSSFCISKLFIQMKWKLFLLPN